MKLQKLFALFAAVVATVALSGCQEKTQDPYIDIEGGTTLTIPKDKATVTVKVKSNRVWKLRMDAKSTEWMVVEPDSGGVDGKDTQTEIKLTVAENTGANRTAAIEFYTGTATTMFTVIQEGPKGETDGVESLSVADFIATADKTTYFRLSGTVSRFSSTYCSFDLTDETGTIYVYSVTDESKRDWSDVIKNGGTVTLQGQYDYYSKNSQHEVVNAIIESFVPGEEQTEITSTTVANFISTASTTIFYRLTGTVSDFKTGTNTSGRNWMQFNLNDGTGTILVYGFEDGQYDKWASKIKDNGTITLVGVYAFFAEKSQHEVMSTTIESFSEGAALETVTGNVAETTAAPDGSPVVIEEATVMAKSKTGLVVADASGAVYVFFSSKSGETVPDVAVGDNVKVEASKSTYGGVPEFTKPSVTKLSAGTASYPEATDITSAAAEYAAAATEFIKLTGTLKMNGDYFNLEINGVDPASRMGSISQPLDAFGVSSYDGQMVTVTGYFSGLSVSKGVTYINVVLTDIAPADPSAKYCTVVPTAIKAKADATSATFEIKANAAWEVNSDNSDFTVSPASGDANATVTVTFSANETDADRVANIRVFCAEAGVETTVVLTQSSASSSAEKPFTNNVTWSLDENAYDNTSSGNSQQSAVINGENLDNLLKLGTSSKNGKATINIPAGTSKLAFFCLGWSGKTSKLTMTCGSKSQTFDIKANAGVVQNPPYTVTTTEEEAYYEFEVTDASATKISLVSEGRVILWGINAY